MEERHHVLHEGPLPPNRWTVLAGTTGVRTASRPNVRGLSIFLFLIFSCPPPLALSNSAYYYSGKNRDTKITILTNPLKLVFVSLYSPAHPEKWYVERGPLGGVRFNKSEVRGRKMASHT